MVVQHGILKLQVRSRKLLEASNTDVKPHTRQKALIIVSEPMKSSNTHMFLTLQGGEGIYAVLITILRRRKENQILETFVNPQFRKSA